jgi:hypothetical protein
MIKMSKQPRKIDRHLLEFKKPFNMLFGRLNRMAHKKNKSRNQIILETLENNLEDEKND